MKIQQVISNFLFVALIITPLWADDISATKCLDLISGTWINDEYRDMAQWGKRVLNENGRVDQYVEASDTYSPKGGDIIINEVRTDNEGNIWFTSDFYDGGYYEGANPSRFELNRISNSESTWEYMSSYYGYPTDIDPDNLYYRIYHRQETLHTESIETSDTDKKILFIGSSFTYYNDGIDTHIEELARSGKPRLNIEADTVAVYNATLEKLWEIKTGAYKAHELLDSGNYDAFVFQLNISWAKKDTLYMNKTGTDNHYQPWVTQTVYVQKFVDKIEEAGAEVVLWTIWETPDRRMWDWITIEENKQAHQEITSELDVKVAPTGLALQRAKEERPNLELILDDKVHPTLHGTYLYVCVIYATIFDRSPIGIFYTPEDFSSEVTEEEAAFLQRIAWETVQEYKAQQ